MVSQRIEDALEVLALMKEHRRRGSTDSVEYLRLDATRRVASRGVNETTVRAHLVGKNVPSKISTRNFDKLVSAWLDTNASDLEKWYLVDANSDEKVRIRFFFASNGGATPEAADIKEIDPSTRVLVATYRILRDTALARRIKAEQEYRCQICGFTLLLTDGRPYAEAHHVRPLGRDHAGPDVPGNILCVCPNCHVLLDYGAVALDGSKIKSIDPEYVDYHNTVILGAKEI